MVTVTGGSGSRGDRLAIIPDALPILSKGHHPPGSGRMCGLGAISWLSGRPEEGAAPSCVHLVLRNMILRTNDLLPDARRHEMWPLLLRAMGTYYPTGLDVHDDHVLSVRLAAWSARRVAHLVPEGERLNCKEALGKAETWCAGGATDASSREKRAAHRAVATTAYYDAADAAAVAMYAVHASAMAGHYDAAYVAAYAAAAAAYSAAAAAYATVAAAYDTVAATTYAAGAIPGAVDAACEARLAMLDGLLTEYDRLTGHAPPDVPADLIAGLGRIVGTVPV